MDSIVIAAPPEPPLAAEPDAVPLQILEHCLSSAVIGVDSERRITAFSQQAEVLLGRERTEVIGQPADLLPSPLCDALLKTLVAGRPIEGQQMLLPLPEGAPVTVQIVTAPLRNTQGLTTGAIAVLNDMTSARHLDENLRRMDRLASLGTLSASMAHEVKNAMVAVKTFVDLLIAKHQDDELAEIVGREMRRINSIVSQMLRFSGPARPNFAVIHLHEVIEHSLCLVQHHLEGRRIKLSRVFAAVPDTLRGDSYQLEQAFLNLFLNALEAMGAEGELEVRTEFLPASEPENRHSPILQVTVHDTGSGISPDNLERLFEPFFTTKPDGTGLGLPITRRIIEEHRGKLTATSVVGASTTFTLLLPSAAKQP